MDKFYDGFQYGVGFVLSVLAILAVGYAILRTIAYMVETYGDVREYLRNGLSYEKDAKQFRRDWRVTNRLGTFINSIIAYLRLTKTEEIVEYNNARMMHVKTIIVRRVRTNKVLSKLTTDLPNMGRRPLRSVA